MKHENIYKLTLTALMAALSYVIFTFLQIQITLPGGDATSFHLGNAVCVLGALLVKISEQWIKYHIKAKSANRGNNCPL